MSVDRAVGLVLSETTSEGLFDDAIDFLSDFFGVSQLFVCEQLEACIDFDDGDTGDCFVERLENGPAVQPSDDPNFWMDEIEDHKTEVLWSKFNVNELDAKLSERMFPAARGFRAWWRSLFR